MSESKNANGALKKALSELKDAEKLFPVAKTISEGLLGAKDAAKEEMEASLTGVRSSARAAETTAKEAATTATALEQRAARIEELAGTIAGDSENASQRADAAGVAAERAETAAKTVQDALGSISTTDESKQTVSGTDAIALAIRKTENIPRLVVAGITGIVKQTVRDKDTGKPVEKKGADLIEYLCAGIESATAAADAAVKDSEAAKQKAEGAEGLVERAETAASKAQGAVEELKSLATSLDLKIKLLFRMMNGELSADQEVKKGVTVADLIEAPVEEEG